MTKASRMAMPITTARTGVDRKRENEDSGFFDCLGGPFVVVWCLADEVAVCAIVVEMLLGVALC